MLSRSSVELLYVVEHFDYQWHGHALSLSDHNEGPRDISPVMLGGANPISDQSHSSPCFRAYPKATFITTQLRCSVWQPLRVLLHMQETMLISGLRIIHHHCLRPTNDTQIHNNLNSVSRWVLSNIMFSNMCPYYRFDISISMTRETQSSTNTYASLFICVLICLRPGIV